MLVTVLISELLSARPPLIAYGKGWLAGWLVDWLVGQLGGWLVG